MCYIYFCIPRTYLTQIMHIINMPLNGKGKQATCPSTNEQVNKIWHIHTTEYYLALKGKAVLTQPTTWMNRGNILTEIIQIQKNKCVLGLVIPSWLTLCSSMDCSPPGSSVYRDSPGKNNGVGCHALLQGIFPTQGLNPGLPHCRQILYHLIHQGSPKILEWAAYPFFRGSSQPRNWTRVSCTAGGFLTSWVHQYLKFIWLF